MKRLALIGLLAAALSTAQAAQPAIDFTATPGSFLDGNTRMLGWQFSVPQAVQVTALGWFDWGQDGLNRSHEVGIWDSATQGLLASVVVAQGNTATLDGFFRWADLAAPLLLQPGVSYRIAGLDIGAGGDPHVWDNPIGGFSGHVNGLTVSSAVQMGAAGTAIGGVASSFSYPSGQIGDARAALFGPNMVLSAVPEPATALLLMGGLALLARRRLL
jgi:Domain of unknown function (DUF4082)/PEP-CTERM motif